MEFDPVAVMGAVAIGGTAGLRIMLPLFLLSLAAAGVVPSGIDTAAIPPDLDWLRSGYAMAGFGAGYLVERFIYLIPVVDTVADGVELMAAPLAGFSLSALMMDLGSTVPAVEGATLAAPAAAILDGGFAQMVAGMLGAALAFMFRVIMLLARMIANLVASGPLIGVMEDLAALMLFFMALLMAWLALLVMGCLLGYIVFRMVCRLSRRAPAVE